MTKVTLNNLANLQNENTAVTTINANNDAIEAGFDNTLSRDGTSPNSMNATLDMNNNQIINLPAPSTVNSPARVVDVVTNPTIVIPGTGTSGHVLGYLDTNNTTSGNNTHSGSETFNGSTAFNGPITFSTALPNSGLANMAAGTVKANITGAPAAPQDVTYSSLKTSMGLVESIAGNTGAFTLTDGLTNTGNAIGLTAARRTTPTVQRFTSTGSATYITPANVQWIRIRLIGAGGGGGQTAASNGGNTTFSTLTGSGGAGGAGGTLGGSGGSASGGNVLNIQGGAGGCGGGSLVANIQGAPGGVGYFGGNGTASNTTSIASAANSGAGGSANANTGTGGGAGGYVEHIIGSPAASYAYNVGTGGSAGSGGQAGAHGIIIVEEYYN